MSFSYPPISHTLSVNSLCSVVNYTTISPGFLLTKMNKNNKIYLIMNIFHKQQISEFIKSCGVCLLALSALWFFVVQGNGAHLALAQGATLEYQTASGLLTPKPVQLSKTVQSEHLNCVRNVADDFLIRYTKPSKTTCYALAPFQTEAVELKRCHCFCKTSQALGLSYEYLRMNILASKAHPPTSTPSA